MVNVFNFLLEMRISLLFVADWCPVFMAHNIKINDNINMVETELIKTGNVQFNALLPYL